MKASITLALHLAIHLRVRLQQCLLNVTHVNIIQNADQENVSANQEFNKYKANFGSLFFSTV